jgi:hypothetical protein
MKHGRGIWKSKDQKIDDGRTFCSTFEGSFMNDMKHGKGKFIWQSGNVYEGEFQNDKRSGIGKLTWIDGSSYIGEWTNGVQNGYGRMIKDSEFSEGLFRNNVFNGSPPGDYQVKVELLKLLS